MLVLVLVDVPIIGVQVQRSVSGAGASASLSDLVEEEVQEEVYNRVNIAPINRRLRFRTLIGRRLTIDDNEVFRMLKRRWCRRSCHATRAAGNRRREKQLPAGIIEYQLKGKEEVGTILPISQKISSILDSYHL